MIERSLDYDLIREIVTDERIYRVTSDDLAPEPDMIRIPASEDIVYLLARDDGHTLGFAMFNPVNGVTYEAHICFLRCAYGAKAKAAFAQMLAWMWSWTIAERICGAIPDYNRLAIAFCKRIGFGEYGVNPQSWLKNGRLHDMVMLGISRPKTI